MSIRIGSMTFDPPLFMAPMEGITDVPFRRMVRKHGAGAICTPMIHAQALLRGTSRRLAEVAALDPAEAPVGMQLCGSEPAVVAAAARKAQDMGAAFVDLNMGCPAPNVVKLGAGAALLRNPAAAAALVRETVRSISIPVTVKMRAGWDSEYSSALEVACGIEAEGACLLAVHARTRVQRFRGKADWNLFTEIKKRISIPVVGNGDVFLPADIERMRAETPVDGVMIARGALGNPWIFSGQRPTLAEIRNAILEHLDLHLRFYANPTVAHLTFRKHLVWYTKGLTDAAEFRQRVFREKSRDVILEMTHGFFDHLEARASSRGPDGD